MESYIFEPGHLAERLGKALCEASARGVRVRLIVDGLGSPGFFGALWPRLKIAGVKVRFYRVSPWILKRLPGDPENLFRRLVLRLRKMNRGNHRKFCLIDQNELWVGSFNVSDVHLREVFGDLAWKDVGVCVRGPELRFARRAFQRAYQGWSTPKWPTRPPRLLLLNDSYLHKRRAKLQQMARLKEARRRIWLATPYFVPIPSFYRRLGRRAKKGLDVRLIIPQKSDVWFIKYISLPLLAGLAKRGVKIYIYEPRFSHQKVFIADGFVSVGSTNINHRSFLHDLEMDVVLSHPTNIRRILENFEADQHHSRPFDDANWEALPAWKRWLSSVFRVIRYWA